MFSKVKLGTGLGTTLKQEDGYFEWCVYLCISCVYHYLSSSGAERICPSQTASNVKILPRHITTKWEGHGPSRSVAQHEIYTTAISQLI